MEILLKYKVSYILKATNANSISMVIWDKELDGGMIQDLKQKYQVVTAREAAVISIIGSNIAKPGVLAKATQVLAENRINIDCVSQSLRQVNIQFVIGRDKFKSAITALNRALCLES
jgi:aspartate kinase